MNSSVSYSAKRTSRPNCAGKMGLFLIRPVMPPAKGDLSFNVRAVK
jgi:hypothetical protein